jgi:hypothetical protein
MEEMENQIQIVAFYTDKDKNKQGFTIYKKAETDEESLKFFTSQKVSGRALGRGWGEKMIHPQIWTNFMEIHKTALLEAASKVPLWTDDETFTNRNEIQDMENLEMTTIKEGRRIGQVPTAAPANVALFQNAVDGWFQFSQYSGSSFDPSLGKQAVSGTTFRGQDQVVQQGKGPHDRLRGKRAKFIEELYRCRILKDIKNEIVKGKKFLATLSGDEMQWVAGELAVKDWNKQFAEKALTGQDFVDGEKEQFIENRKQEIIKLGAQHMLEILKDEFRDIEIRMGINVAGKQKDLQALSDKVLSIFQFVMSNPVAFQQGMQIPGMSDAMNNILEYSGVNQAEFSAFTQKLATMETQQQAQGAQMQQMLPAPQPA